MLDNIRGLDQFEDYFRDLAEYIEKAISAIFSYWMGK